MADYWKSNPRKFCEFCKCWFADNKSSTQFHERGKRHQENVEKKIGELRKKGQKQHETQQQLSGFLKQMEEGAMKAFKKDVADNPELVPEYKVALVEKRERDSEEDSTALPGSRFQPGIATTSEQSVIAAATRATTTTTTGQGQSEWVEAVSPEGHTYYWNTATGASQWVKPENFTPVDSSASQQKGLPEKQDKGSGDESADNAEDEEGKADTRRSGLKRRHDAYGGWSSVSTEVEEAPDLQLPEASPMYLSLYVPQAAQYEPREKLTIKEKTVGSISTSDGGGSASFKKRKAGGRQIRSRDTTS